MTKGRWSSDYWVKYSSSAKTKTREELFSLSLKDKFNPKKILMRESRDSDKYPNSTAIILGLDVTGSMGAIAEALAKNHLGTLMEEIYKRKPVSDPHICIMGIGDVECDKAPLQVSQFEADIKIAEELKDLWLEGGGGGNRWESYNLPWYFAAYKTSIDCWEKRNKKGFLFTIGDEMSPPDLNGKQLEKVFGNSPQPISNDNLLTLVSRKYEVFHIIIEEGDYARRDLIGVKKSWENMLGKQHVVSLSSYKAISETIISILQVATGEDAKDVSSSWNGDKNVIVRDAISGLATYKPTKKIVRLS